MVRIQTVDLHYMIVQRCLAQMERAPNECPGPDLARYNILTAMFYRDMMKMFL